MNDYLVIPVIGLMVLFFMFNYIILDCKFDKTNEKFHECKMRDMDLKYKLESMERQLDRLQEDIRRK